MTCVGESGGGVDLGSISSIDATPQTKRASVSKHLLRLDTKITSGSGTTITKGGSNSGGLERSGGDIHIGRFRVLRVLGMGGMGIVYAAYDPELDREVAIKLILGACDDAEARTRLYREAQALAKLAHPNVVVVHDVGTHQGQVWVSMEFVVGRTLGDWIKEERPHWRLILSVFKQAARGIVAAHAVGLLHRDLKPANIMIGDDGRVRVMDFGLARVGVEHEQRLKRFDRRRALSIDLTDHDVIVGTPAYMAPEQFLGNVTDERTDEFALAVTLWEALYGKRPFAGKTFDALRVAVLSGKREPAPTSSKVPAWLRRILERSLSLNPEKRFSSVRALLNAIESRERRGRTRIAAAGVMLGVMLASFGGYALSHALFEQSPICDESDRLADDWNESRRGAVGEALRASGHSYAEAVAERTLVVLDRYADDWLAASEEACAATRLRGEQSLELMDARLTCLERRRRAMKALVGVLSDASSEDGENKRIDWAVQAAVELPRIERCADLSYVTARVPPPEDEAIQEAAKALEDRLARAEALRSAGQYSESRALAEELLSAASSLGYAPLVVRTQALLGNAVGDTGESERAVKLLEESFLGAEALGMDEIASWSALRLAAEYSARLGRIEVGLRWIDLARAKATRLDDMMLRAGVHNNVAMIQSATGDSVHALENFQVALALAKEHDLGNIRLHVAYDNVGSALRELGRQPEALKFHKRALTEVERVLGSQHPDAASTWNNLGIAYRDLGEYKAAEDAFMRGLEIHRNALGSGHPRIARLLINMGNLADSRCQLDRARAHYDEAMRIMKAAYGPEHPSIGGITNNVGNTLLSLEQYADALSYFEHACEIWSAALGENHRHVDLCAYNRARALLGMGRATDALPLAERALALRDRGKSPNKGDVAMALTRVAQVELALARHESAGSRMQRALELSRDVILEPGDLAIVHFVAARSLWALDRSSRRARALAEQALDALNEPGSCGPERAAIESALRKAP